MQVADRALIEERLARVLKRSVRVDAYRMLGSGISGAATYRLTIDGVDFVLKLTDAGSAPYVRERARREVTFYQEMAGRVPLNVPRVMGTYTDAAGSILLLQAYEPSPPPQTWPGERYLIIAQQLARFHAAFWGRTGDLDAYSWLLRPDRQDVTAQIEQAHQHWRALRERPHLTAILTAACDQWIHRVVAEIGIAEAIITSLPLTLCHGDCNPGNILIDADGSLIWTDWQEVRVARGPEDLSFLIQQTTILGGIPSYDAILAAYRDTLSAETGQDYPLALLQQAVAAAELRSRALHWPAYLAEAAPDVVTAMLDRIRDLATCLGIAD